MNTFRKLLVGAFALSFASTSYAISFTMDWGTMYSRDPGVNMVNDFEDGRVPTTTGFATYRQLPSRYGTPAALIAGPAGYPQTGPGRPGAAMANPTSFLVVNPYIEFYGTDQGFVQVEDALEISFNGPTNYFGFLWGTPDWYNDVYFFLGDRLLSAFSGNRNVMPGWAPNYPEHTRFVFETPGAEGQAFVNFYSESPTDLFDRVVLASGHAFETDNHSFKTEIPEPASLMLLGFGLLGAALRRRSA